MTAEMIKYYNVAELKIEKLCSLMDFLYFNLMYNKYYLESLKNNISLYK